MLLKVVKNIGLFIVGFTLSVGLIYRDQFFAGFKTSIGHQKSNYYSPQVLPAYALQTNIGLIDNSIEKNNRFLIQKLLDSIEIGTPLSLEQIRLKKISSLPGYVETVLPLLKQKALNVLLSRLTTADLRSWPNIAFNSRGRQSRARLFIDDILFVNKPLGVFLETSTQLLYGLYHRTLAGQFYDVGKDLKYILDHAESLVLNRSNLLEPARQRFDQNIIQDEIFLTILEQERCRQVGHYVESNPLGAANYFSLISSLEPRYCHQGVHKVVANLIRRFVVNASPALRQKICEDDTTSRVLRKFAILNPVIRKSLSGLYLITAMDALESEQIHISTKFLNESIDIEEGLQGQNVLLEALANREAHTNKAAIQDQPKANEIKSFLNSLRNPSINENYPVAENLEIKGGVSYMGTGVILVLIIGVMLFLANTVSKLNQTRIDNLNLFEHLPTLNRNNPPKRVNN